MDLSRRFCLHWTALGLCSRPWALAHSAGSSWVEVEIDLRAAMAHGLFDPAHDQIGVRGAPLPLRWDRSAFAQPVPGTVGRFATQLRFEPGALGEQPVSYKFKIERPGQPDAGWETGPNRSVVLQPRGETRVARAFDAPTDAPPPRRTGRIDRLAARPSAFVTPREVQVWLPPGYEQATARRYPVLYLQDGQNLFDHLAAGAEWQVDETAQRLVLAGAVQPMIIVAVASNAQRVLDYTPWPDAVDGRSQGGGAAAYGHYLVEELKPWIDAQYRTQPQREATALGGSSLGGLLTMWLLGTQPQTFGAGLVVSPSVWWAQQALLAQLRQVPLHGLPPPRVWLDMGREEGDHMLQGAQALRDTLLARGWPVHYLEQPGAGHDEFSWAGRVEPMLRFLFGPGPG
jgi:predicted alpha/beta superfamily hydrolase